MTNRNNSQNFSGNEGQERQNGDGRDITAVKMLEAVDARPPIVLLEWLVKVNQRRMATHRENKA